MAKSGHLDDLPKTVTRRRKLLINLTVSVSVRRLPKAGAENPLLNVTDGLSSQSSSSSSNWGEGGKSQGLKDDYANKM